MGISLSAAPLTSSAFGANPAGAGTDHLVAATNRTGDSHKHAAKRDRYPVGVTIAVPVLSARFGIAGLMICDHVDYFFLGRARQIRDGPVHSLFLNLRNFL